LTKIRNKSKFALIEMKFFISYCDNDGLRLASSTANTLEGRSVMLAPIQIYSKFVKGYWSELAESNGATDQIKIEGCDIQIV